MAETGRDTGYERKDTHVGSVLVAGALIAACVVVAAGAAWLLVHLSGGDPAGANGQLPPAIAGPRLQTAPAVDLAAFQREKRERLEGYGWVDRAAGRVHIPIERAMELMVGGRDPRAIPGEGQR